MHLVRLDLISPDKAASKSSRPIMTTYGISLASNHRGLLSLAFKSPSLTFRSNKDYLAPPFKKVYLISNHLEDFIMHDLLRQLGNNENYRFPALLLLVDLSSSWKREIEDRSYARAAPKKALTRSMPCVKLHGMTVITSSSSKGVVYYGIALEPDYYALLALNTDSI